VPPRRRPWRPPEVWGKRIDLWLAARALHDDPQQTWSYPMMTNRVLVGDKHGLNFTYESASSWDELVQVLTLKRWAEEAGWARLAMGIQCTLGLETYDGVLRSATGRLRNPESWERFRGRHIVVPVGWEPTTDEVLFLNSWGRNWGDHGFGYVGREFFEAHVDSVNLTRPAWLGFSPAMEQAVVAGAPSFRNFGALSREAFQEYWKTGNRKDRYHVLVNRETCEIRHRELITLARGDRYDVVEIRERGEFRGRMHVQHDDVRDISTLTELWVPPGHRRRGFGTVLLRAGERYARKAGSTRVWLPLHDADAGEVGHPRAEVFAQSVGYKWRLRQRKRPNYEALGTRDLAR
jgi:GNAT superfamily N-acetyltransferase